MITCMAIDDEPLALELLTDYIGKVPFLQLVYINTNAIEALQYLQQKKADLLFLDIQMPDLTGLQVMKIIQNHCRVILTTAYSEYALDGYERQLIVRALDETSGNVAEAARRLQTDRPNLYRRMKRLGIGGGMPDGRGAA